MILGQPSYETQEIEKLKKRIEDLEQSNRVKDEKIANLKLICRHIETDQLIDASGGLRVSQISMALSVDESLQRLTDENFDLVFGDDANEFGFVIEQSSSSTSTGRHQTLKSSKQLEKRISYLLYENHRQKVKMIDENFKNNKKLSYIQEKYKQLPIELQNLHRENVKLNKKIEEKKSSSKVMHFRFKRKTT